MSRPRKPLGRHRSKHRELRQKYAPLHPASADRMWAVRTTLDLTQAQMAELCGFTASWVSRIECGYGLPKGTSLAQFVEATGLSADFLLGVDASVQPRVARAAERHLEQAAEEMVTGVKPDRKRERELVEAGTQILERA